MQSIHTGVLSILVSFKLGVLVLKENPPGTSFNPTGSQSGNQGGVNFILAEKQMIKNKQIHNSSFLISPTTNLFPLSGQSGSRGVSITINLKYKIWNMKLILK